MSLLARSELIRLIRSGELRVEPFEESQVGAGSIDLHLGNDFRVFRKGARSFEVTDEADYERITEAIRVEDGEQLLMRPGELVNGITREKLTLPESLAAFIEGRSSLARVGLITHLSSGFIHPGTSNRTVLEIANVSPLPLTITPGTRICQVIVFEVKGRGKYRGRFARQLRP
jgi:dCTP deaminase